MALISWLRQLLRTGFLRAWLTPDRLKCSVMRRRKVLFGVFPPPTKGGRIVGSLPVANGAEMWPLILAAKRVPWHFASPDAWSKTDPVLSDNEVSHLAAAAVLPLDERGDEFLLVEEKLISQGIFTRLSAGLTRRKFPIYFP